MPREKAENDFDESLTAWQLDKLAELLGEEDPRTLGPVVRDLKRALRDVRHTGNTAHGMYDSRRKMFVIPLDSIEQQARFLKVFERLGIMPWHEKENATLVIEHPDDVKKLAAMGAIPPVEPRVIQTPQPKAAPEKQPTEAASPVTQKHEESAIKVPEIPVDIDAQKYAFAPDSTQLELYKERRRRAKTIPSKVATENEEHQAEKEEDPVPEDTYEGLDRIFDEFDSGKVDSTFDAQELERIFDEFESGKVDENYDEVVRTLGDVPVLKLFPRTYIWKDKKPHHRLSGKPVLKAEYNKLRSDVTAVFKESSEEGEWWRLKKVDSKKERAAYASMTELVRMHTGLVVIIAARNKNLRPSANADDMLQEGMIGLMRAIIAYDRSEKKFSTFAGHYIQGRMRSWNRDTLKTIYMPAHAQDSAAAYHRVSKGLAQVEQTDKPDRQVLAAALREKDIMKSKKGDFIPDDYLDRALDKFERQLFINAIFSPFDTVGDASLLDVHIRHDVVSITGRPIKEEVPADVEAMRSETRRLLHEALGRLPERERLVICMRFGIVPIEKPDLGTFLREVYSSAMVYGSESEDSEALLKRIMSVFERRGAARDNNAAKETYRTLTQFTDALRKYPNGVPDGDIVEEIKGPGARKEVTLKMSPAVLFLLAYVGRLSEEQIQQYVYDKDFTLEGTGDILGITRERMRQIEAKGLRKLKHPFRARGILKAAPPDMLPDGE